MSKKKLEKKEELEGERLKYIEITITTEKNHNKLKTNVNKVENTSKDFEKKIKFLHN